jgi:ubiquinone/menaquinone biosynthesis C-methylase UbiE
MAKDSLKQDKHFPNFFFSNPFRRLLTDPRQFNTYIRAGQTVADLGCGPGFFAMPLADRVGNHGCVYAVDSNENAIAAVKRKAAKNGLNNINAIVTSVANLEMIPDDSVDFILGYGLLCSVAPKDCKKAVEEIKRIMKPDGKAYLNAAKGSISYLSDADWESILSNFKVEWRNASSDKEYVSLVSKTILK